MSLGKIVRDQVTAHLAAKHPEALVDCVLEAEEARRAKEILRSLGFGIGGSLLDAVQEAAEFVREKRQPFRRPTWL